jgi:hypothetical protein
MFSRLEQPSQVFWLASDLNDGRATHDWFRLSFVACGDDKALRLTRRHRANDVEQISGKMSLNAH